MLCLPLMVAEADPDGATRPCPPPPMRPKMAQNRHIPSYNKKTKQLLFKTIMVYIAY